MTLDRRPVEDKHASVEECAEGGDVAAAKAAPRHLPSGSRCVLQWRSPMTMMSSGPRHRLGRPDICWVDLYRSRRNPDELSVYWDCHRARLIQEDGAKTISNCATQHRMRTTERVERIGKAGLCPRVTRADSRLSAFALLVVSLGAGAVTVSSSLQRPKHQHPGPSNLTAASGLS